MGAVSLLNGIRVATAGAAGLLIQDAAGDGTTVVGTFWNVVLWAVFVTGALIVVWTIPALHSRLPRVRVERRPGIGVRLLPPVHVGKKRLRERLGATSDGVLALLSDYEAEEPRWVPPRAEGGWGDKSQEEQALAFQQEAQRTGQRLQEYLGRYQNEFSAEALHLFDAMVERGHESKVERERFGWPVNTFGLRDVGQQMGVWARGL